MTIMPKDTRKVEWRNIDFHRGKECTKKSLGTIVERLPLGFELRF